MSLWTITLVIGYIIIIVLNLIFSFSLTTALNLLLCLVIIMVPSAIILVIGRLFPKKWFDENNFLFKIGRFKQKICKITNVKAWKDKIPVGCKVLQAISQPKDKEFLSKFIYESCFAEWLHSFICYWSLIACLIIFFINKSLVLPMAVPIAVWFIYQNLTSTVIQWYVRPRMISYRELVRKRKERHAGN